MMCPNCQAEAQVQARSGQSGDLCGPHGELVADVAICPDCGGVVGATADTQTRVVEGTIEPQPLPEPAEPVGTLAASRSLDDRDASERALVLATQRHPALVAAVRLPALAWQQPAVRSVVKTGASAAALTLALRLAGRIVARRAVREVTNEGLLPIVADLISPSARESRPTRRARHGEVSEIIVYMRRTIQL